MRYAVVRRILPFLLVAAMVPVGLWGVAQAQAPKTLVIAIGADQTGMDPQTVENNESGFVMSTMYDSIVNYKPGSSVAGPGLAESWSVSPDGKVYTFKFRHGVSFHDGTVMNARTVAQDVDRAIHAPKDAVLRFLIEARRSDVDGFFEVGAIERVGLVKQGQHP